jgi:3-oxoadipate enol-lactonase
MPFTTINGVKLNYELHGDAGEPLVLVHGYTGDITDWRHQLPVFGQSHRVLIVDLRGHGESEAVADRSQYAIDHFVSDVEALVDEVGFDLYHLLGHSMGGAVVQEIALKAPERLISLTLHDTSDNFKAAFMNAAVVMWRDYRFKVAEEQGMRVVSQLTYPFPPPPHMPRERTEETNERLANMSLDSFVGAWHGLSDWEGTVHRAQAIGTPTLVIWGDMDSQFIIDSSKRLAKTIPGASEAIVPEAGHSPQYERPPLFNEALAGFLERVSAATAAH